MFSLCLLLAPATPSHQRGAVTKALWKKTKAIFTFSGRNVAFYAQNQRMSDIGFGSKRYEARRGALKGFFMFLVSF